MRSRTAGSDQADCTAWAVSCQASVQASSTAGGTGAFGAYLEVVGPPEVRQELGTLALELTRLYQAPTSSAGSGGAASDTCSRGLAR